MAVEFKFDQRVIPALGDQRGAQLRFGVLGQLIAGHVIALPFEHAAGVAIELANERRFPIVPRLGAHTTNIADGQHGQQIQSFDRLHRFGKSANCARVRNITLLRHVRHHEVIAHQPFH